MHSYNFVFCSSCTIFEYVNNSHTTVAFGFFHHLFKSLLSSDKIIYLKLSEIEHNLLLLPFHVHCWKLFILPLNESCVTFIFDTNYLLNQFRTLPQIFSNAAQIVCHHRFRIIKDQLIFKKFLNIMITATFG